MLDISIPDTPDVAYVKQYIRDKIAKAIACYIKIKNPNPEIEFHLSRFWEAPPALADIISNTPADAERIKKYGSPELFGKNRPTFVIKAGNIRTGGYAYHDWDQEKCMSDASLVQKILNQAFHNPEGILEPSSHLECTAEDTANKSSESLVCLCGSPSRLTGLIREHDPKYFAEHPITTQKFLF